jgi:hypothetical protein
MPGETPENRSGQIRQWKLAGEPPALLALHRSKRYVKEQGGTTWENCTLAGREVKKKDIYYYAPQTRNIDTNFTKPDKRRGAENAKGKEVLDMDFTNFHTLPIESCEAPIGSGHQTRMTKVFIRELYELAGPACWGHPITPNNT